MSIEEIKELVKTCKSKTELCINLGYHTNGNGYKKVNDIIVENGLDISHFKSRYVKPGKYKEVEKTCPVCETKFKTKIGHSHEKTTCSYSCSNTYFRSGINNPNWKDEAYRSTCFHYHEHKCVVCGEDKILDVHHFDENRANNNPENLIPICPTHHTYFHSKYRNIVEPIIIEYRTKFISSSGLIG